MLNTHLKWTQLIKSSRELLDISVMFECFHFNILSKFLRDTFRLRVIAFPQRKEDLLCMYYIIIYVWDSGISVFESKGLLEGVEAFFLFFL